MKKLFTLLVGAVSLTAAAQVEFPWNPDSDGDDFIGVNDLMALLGEFDSVFSEEGLYLSEDSLSAMYDAGTMNFLDCQIACKNLPGRWSMPEFEDVTVTGQQMWLKSQGYPNNLDKALLLTVAPAVGDAYVSYERGCFCVTKERPKVEYSFCSAGDFVLNVDGMQSNTADFQECCDAKVQDGWYPLGGFSKGNSADASQAFWRWAD